MAAQKKSWFTVSDGQHKVRVVTGTEKAAALNGALRLLMDYGKMPKTVYVRRGVKGSPVAYDIVGPPMQRGVSKRNPRRDGTGPAGRGPRTGRGKGPCKRNPTVITAEHIAEALLAEEHAYAGKSTYDRGVVKKITNRDIQEAIDTFGTDHAVKDVRRALGLLHKGKLRTLSKKGAKRKKRNPVHSQLSPEKFDARFMAAFSVGVPNKDGDIPASRWKTIKAVNAESAALAGLRRQKDAGKRLAAGEKITVHVAGAKTKKHHTGVPVVTTAYTFSAK